MDKDPDFLFFQLNEIKGLNSEFIDLGLSRISSLLEKLNNPHKKIAPTIHVAGTNGKGSVVAMIRAILESYGYKIHVYTSPHLVSYTERIRISGKNIDPHYFSSLIKFIQIKNNSDSITFFEFITALAFLAFSENEADFVLLETGLGGRLDATNVIENPYMTIITQVDFDHEKFLGNKISSIASEKAGILKEDSPCILAKQRVTAFQAIEDIAKKINVPLFYQNRDWYIEKNSYDEVIFSDNNTTLNLSEPSLNGPHQIDNMGIALASISKMDLDIKQNNIINGLSKVNWPGRCQRIYRGPLVDLLVNDLELWLDGGHNPAAAYALGKWMETYSSDYILICGIGVTKDAKKYLSVLSQYSSIIRTVSFRDNQSCFSSHDLGEIAKSVGFSDVEAKSNLAEAICSILPKVKNKKSRILICGSLYLAGEVLENHS